MLQQIAQILMSSFPSLSTNKDTIVLDSETKIVVHDMLETQAGKDYVLVQILKQKPTGFVKYRMLYLEIGTVPTTRHFNFLLTKKGW